MDLHPATAPDGWRLTTKQELFVSYYLGEARFNATVAAKMAGYGTPEQTGYHAQIGVKNLANEYVRARVQRGLAAVAMSCEEIIARYSLMASDILPTSRKRDAKGDTLTHDALEALNNLARIRSMFPTAFGGQQNVNINIGSNQEVSHEEKVAAIVAALGLSHGQASGAIEGEWTEEEGSAAGRPDYGPQGDDW